MLREYYQYYAYYLDPFFLIYFSGINIVYSVLLLLGSIKLYRRREELSTEDFTNILRSDSLPNITFVVPCYNESTSVIHTVDSLLNLDYRYKKIIVVNDGSKDDSLDLLFDRLQLLPIPKTYDEVIHTQQVRMVYRSTLHPDVMVIDKENGQRFDAINAGINACQTDLLITIDGDTFVDNENFEALIRPILASPKTVALGASVRIRNGCTFDFNRINTDKFPENYITAMQSLEYLRSFLMRVGWDFAGGDFCLAGAFTVFSKDILVKVGGLADTFANDLEIIIRFNRILKDTKTPYEISYFPDPVAWTDGPETYKQLAYQRMVWQRGEIESMWFHKNMLFNPRYGFNGVFVYPFMLFGEVLEPLFEVIGYTYIVVGLFVGVVNPLYIFLFLCVTWGYTFIFSLFCLFIEELSFRKYPTLRSFWLLFLYSFLENFGYRQLTLIWRVHGFLSFFSRFDMIKNISKKVNNSVEEVIKKGRLQ